MLHIVGDINLTDGFFDTGFGVGSLVASGKNPFERIKYNTGDFWIGNFECVFSDIYTQTGTHSKQFRISPKELSGVDHLDFYGVANNHVMQHGADAYIQLLSYHDSKDIAYAGTDTKRTEVIIHQGKKVSVTVFNQRPENFTKPPLYWAMPEYSSVSAELNKYTDCDYRIVYIHWGVEFINYPYNDQKQLAHFLVDAGADLVIGMHPHVMQGFEIYKGKHIFYSLGNCVFNMPWEPTKYSLVVNVDLEKRIVSYQYLHIETDCFPSFVENVPERYSIEYLNGLIDICEDNEKYFLKVQDRLGQYRKANRKDIVNNLFKLKIGDLGSILSDFVKRKIKK